MKSKKGLLPELSVARSTVLGKGDALLVVGGFEDRGLAFGDFFQSDHEAEAILLEYRPKQQNNRVENVHHLLGEIGFVQAKINQLIFDRMNPEGLIELIRNLLRERNVHHVFLDISALSKLAILACLEACRDVNLSLFYAEAQVYGPSKEKYEEARKNNRVHQPTSEIQTETHLGGVHHLRCFSSVAMQNAPIAILGFLSFNEKLIQALLNRFNPSHIFLINGRPPELSWREEATAWIYERLLQEWSQDNPLTAETQLPTRVASTLDYRESFMVLQELYWEHFYQYKIILAPTGSKMQAVGCHLFRAIHPDVHIEYPTPQGYLNEYSSGIGAVWSLDMGHYSALLEKLQCWDHSQNLLIH